MLTVMKTLLRGGYRVPREEIMGALVLVGKSMAGAALGSGKEVKVEPSKGKVV